jgi:hypothetical protein
MNSVVHFEMPFDDRDRMAGARVPLPEQSLHGVLTNQKRLPLAKVAGYAERS